MKNQGQEKDRDENAKEQRLDTVLKHHTHRSSTQTPHTLIGKREKRSKHVIKRCPGCGNLITELPCGTCEVYGTD